MYKGWMGASLASICGAVLPILTQGSGQLILGQAPEPAPVPGTLHSIWSLLHGLVARYYSVVLQSRCSIANILNFLAVANSLARLPGVSAIRRGSDLPSNCHLSVEAGLLTLTIDCVMGQIDTGFFNKAVDFCDHGS